MPVAKIGAKEHRFKTYLEMYCDARWRECNDKCNVNDDKFILSKTAMRYIIHDIINHKFETIVVSLCYEHYGEDPNLCNGVHVEIYGVDKDNNSKPLWYSPEGADLKRAELLWKNWVQKLCARLFPLPVQIEQRRERQYEQATEVFEGKVIQETSKTWDTYLNEVQYERVGNILHRV